MSKKLERDQIMMIIPYIGTYTKLYIHNVEFHKLLLNFRSYRATDTRDTVQIHKSLLREIEGINPIDHQKRINIVNQWEPRWAMQRFRNQKYETAKFEKVFLKKLQLKNKFYLMFQFVTKAQK